MESSKGQKNRGRSLRNASFAISQGLWLRGEEIVLFPCQAGRCSYGIYGLRAGLSFARRAVRWHFRCHFTSNCQQRRRRVTCVRYVDEDFIYSSFSISLFIICYPVKDCCLSSVLRSPDLPTKITLQTSFRRMSTTDQFIFALRVA